MLLLSSPNIIILFDLDEEMTRPAKEHSKADNAFDRLQERVTSLYDKLVQLKETQKIQQLGYNLLRIDQTLKRAYKEFEDGEDFSTYTKEFEEKLYEMEEEIDFSSWQI